MSKTTALTAIRVAERLNPSSPTAEPASSPCARAAVPARHARSPCRSRASASAMACSWPKRLQTTAVPGNAARSTASHPAPPRRLEQPQCHGARQRVPMTTSAPA